MICQYRNEKDFVCEYASAFANNKVHVPPEFCKNCMEYGKAKMLRFLKFNIDAASPLPDDIDELKAKIESGEIKFTRDIQPPKRIYTQKTLPSKLQMAKNLTKTAIEVAKKALTEGRVLCCAEQIKDRRMVCDKCDHQKFINEHERCVSFRGDEPGCGCYLEQKRKLAGARCDLGNWDEVDTKYEPADAGDPPNVPGGRPIQTEPAGETADLNSQ